VPTPAPTLVHGRYLLVIDRGADSAQTYKRTAMLIRPDGSDSRVLSSGTPTGLYQPYDDLWAVWSHNATTIHLIRGCSPKLYDASVLGGSAVLKATMTDKDQGFVWSPNEAKIAYWHYTGVNVWCMQNSVDDTVSLMVMNANGSNKKVLYPGAHMDNGLVLQGWTPDGTKLVVKFSTGWKTVDASTGAQVGILGAPTTASKVEFSPDGQKIGYVNAGHAWVRPLLAVFATDLGEATDFAWKPDSSGMAVIGNTLRVSTFFPVATTTVYAGATRKATWSPDGAQLAFLKAGNPWMGGKVYVVAATGGTAVAVPGPSNVNEVYWQP
jgi:hypothetical protein